MKYVTIHHDSSAYCSFPSVVWLPSGALVVAFREAGPWSAEVARGGAPTHHDNDSGVRVVGSPDGDRWSPLTLHRLTVAPYGVNDPALCVLRNGAIALRFAAVHVLPAARRAELQGPLTAHRADLGTVTGVVGNYWVRSVDGGQQWDAPRLLEAGDLTATLSRDPVTELADGTLILPVYQSEASCTERALLIRSWDEGRSWGDMALIAADPAGRESAYRGVNFNETAVLSLGGNRLLAMIRADSSYYTDGEHMSVGGVGELCSSFSDNNGMSWSAPKGCGIWGQPAHLLRLQGGEILCTYGHRRKPYGVRACLSDDEGRSWRSGEPFLIREDCPGWDMGYPVSAQGPDGRILTVYYWIDPGGVRYVEGAFWSPSNR